MAESLKSTYDFIKSAFAIRVGVLSSQDAEIVSERNNLSFCELIQPFCTLTNEAHIQGIGSQSYRAYNMHIRMSDIRHKNESIEKVAVQQLISDLVLKSGPDESIRNITVPCRQYDLSVNRSCPWTDTYRDLLFKFGPPQDHEFLNHHVACMLVVSSLHPNPMQEFANLSQLQNHIQHRDKDNSNCQWMTPNTLKYFVLLHDVQQSNEEKAKNVYSTLQATYGTKVCYLLRINSGHGSTTDTETNLPDPWCQFMNFSTPSVQSENNPSNSINGTHFKNETNDHATSNQQWLQELQKSSKLTTDKGFGCCLTLADHDQLRTFMQNFIIYALLPHMEKTIKNINEQISARKALHKSLFRATRTLFGSNKVSSPSGSSTGYNQDANEMLVRKIADLCFLSQMYDQAFNHYHNARKDYTNDQAWLYAAGASEMAASSNFMQRSSQKSYPSHYMESAITTYIDVCKNDYLALRCTLMHAECLQLMGMFNEAAFYLIKVTTETDDLRSALLLEQAAHCYLKLKEPQARKFAFHLILAGHRFSKCAQRRHALRCYSLALQVYLEQGWGLAEDHINFTMARQSFNLKNLAVASESFRNLLSHESFQTSTQQAAFFHEFIHIFQQCQNSDESYSDFAMLGLPKLLDSETSVSVEYNDTSEMLDETLIPKVSRLEDVVLSSESSLRNSLVGSIKCFCKSTQNIQCPQTSVGENIRISIVLKNYLNIPISLSNVSLQFKFMQADTDEEVSASDCNEFVKFSVLSQVGIHASTSKTLAFYLQPLKPGKLIATGLLYNVGLSSEEKQEENVSDFSYFVKDHQPFNVLGRRLNGTKEDQCTVAYERDHRLDLQVLPVLPALTVRLENLPVSMMCNEVIKTSMMLQNCGTLPLDVVKIVSEDKVQFAIDGKNSHKYFLPNAGTVHCGPDKEAKTIPNIFLQPLMPGEVRTMDVWIKAPETSGMHRADMLFYYKSNSLKTSPNSKAFLNTNSLMCEEVAHIHPALMTALNQDTFVISLNIKNVASVEGFIFFVEDVSCPSSVYTVELMSEKNSVGLSANNNLAIYLKLKKSTAGAKPDPSNKDHKELSCFASNKSSKVVQIIVHWKGKYEGRESVLGQHCLSLDEMFQNVGTFSPPLIQPNAKQEEISLQTLHQLLTWRLQYEASVKHNFTLEKLCLLKLNLVMCNLSNLELLVSISVPSIGSNNFSKPQSQAPFAWLGITEAKKILPPHGKHEVELTACFTRYGIFNISSVSVTAIPQHLKESTLQLPQKPPCGYFVNIESQQGYPYQ